MKLLSPDGEFVIPDRLTTSRPVAPGDAVAIRQLFHVYCHRIDQGTPEDIAVLFASDGVLELSFTRDPQELQGRKAIGEWFTRYMRDTRRQSRHNRHSIAAPLALYPDDDDPQRLVYARTFWNASGIRRETGTMHQLRGFYQDWLRKHDRHWCFQRREIHIWDSWTVDPQHTQVLRPDPVIPQLFLRVWSYEKADAQYFHTITPKESQAE